MHDAHELRPAALLLTGLLAVCLLALPRRWAPVPIFIAAAFIPADQRVVIATLDFTMMRLLIGVALLRLWVRGELKPVGFHGVDKMVLAFVASVVVSGTLLLGTTGALVNRLGIAFDLLGLYFFTRMSLRSWGDATRTVTAAAACMVCLGLLMTVEWTSGYNLFSVIGGVPEHTVVRSGRLRCQGAFAHPILAGVFAASWFPLLAWSALTRRQLLSSLGLLACAAVVMLSSSSTPILALVLALLGLALWPLRQNLSLLRWGAVAMLVLLHFVREKPVYRVIDRAIEHFGDWWLIGVPDVSYWKIHFNDITNQYVATGIDGGLLPMLLFIALLAVAFREVGRTWRVRGLRRAQRRLAWACGATLFVHAGVFFALTYFGQMSFVFYHHIALVGALADLRQQRLPQGARAAVPPQHSPASAHPPVRMPVPVPTAAPLVPPGAAIREAAR
jgi:hypothetical protein